MEADHTRLPVDIFPQIRGKRAYAFRTCRRVLHREERHILCGGYVNINNSGPVFLFDVDNTLLDNDRVAADLKRHLAASVGEESQARYWDLFEKLRAELGYADYLGALQRYRVEHPREPKLLEVSYFMINY